MKMSIMALLLLTACASKPRLPDASIIIQKAPAAIMVPAENMKEIPHA